MMDKQRYFDLRRRGYSRDRIRQIAATEDAEYREDFEGADWGNRVRAVAQGALFGWSDEIEAGARALVSDRPYEEIRDDIRADYDQYAQANPGESLALELAGGFAVPGLGGVKAAGKLMSGAGRLKQLTTAGALEGAVAGAGGAQEAADVPFSAGMGAAMGAPMGAAGRLLERTLASRGNRQAENLMNRQLGGQTPADVAQEAARMGGTIADVNENLRDLAGVAYRSGPENKEQYRRFLLDRQRRMAEREIPDTVQDVTGVRETPLEAAERLSQARRTRADELYGEVEDLPIDQTAGMSQKLNFAEGKAAARGALDDMRMDYNNPDLSLEEATDTLAFWDGWQKHMHGLAKKEARTGNTYQAGQIRKRAEAVIKELDDQTDGAYQAARKAWAEDTAILEAIDGGGDFFRVTPEVLRRRVQNMSSEAREGVVLGAVEAILNKAGNSPDTANTARNMLKTPYLRERFRILLGENKFDDLDRRLTDIIEKHETYAKVLTGSQTADKLSAQQVAAAGDSGLGVVADNMLNLNPGMALREGAQVLTGPRVPTMAANQAGATLDMMMLENPQAMAEALEALRRSTQGRGFAPALPMTLANYGAMTIPGYGAPQP